MASLLINLPATGGGGGGDATIGNPVIGGIPTDILFIDVDGNLAQSNDFTFDGAELKLGPLFSADIAGNMAVQQIAIQNKIIGIDYNANYTMSGSATAMNDTYQAQYFFNSLPVFVGQTKGYSIWFDTYTTGSWIVSLVLGDSSGAHWQGGVTPFDNYGPTGGASGSSTLAGQYPLVIDNLGNITSTGIFTGDGSGLTNLPGATIGHPVVGGTATDVLFVDNSGNLSQSDDFSFDGTTVHSYRFGAQTSQTNGGVITFQEPGIITMEPGGTGGTIQFTGNGDGNISLSGTVDAGQFVGGGAGITGVNLTLDVSAITGGSYGYIPIIADFGVITQDSAFTFDLSTKILSANFFAGDGSGLTNIPGPSIGGPVVSSSPNEILYTDASGNLAQNAGFQFDSANITLALGPTAVENNSTYPSGSFFEGQHIATDIPVGGMNVLAMATQDSIGTNATPPYGVVFGMYGAVDTGGPVVPYLVTTQFGIGGLGLSFQSDFMGNPIGFTMFGTHQDDGSGAIVQVNGDVSSTGYFHSTSGFTADNGSYISTYAANGVTTNYVEVGPINDSSGQTAIDVDSKRLIGTSGQNYLSWDGGIGFFGASAIAQGAAIADATNAVDVITQLNTLLAYLRLRGDIAT